MTHLFYDDWIEGDPFDEELDDYRQAVEDATIVGTYCGKTLAFGEAEWTFQFNNTTCEECRDAYALELLGNLP